MSDIDISKANNLTDLSKDVLLTLAVGYLGGLKKKIYTIQNMLTQKNV